MNWLTGSMNGSGSAETLIAPGATLNLPNPYTLFLNSRTLDNAGTIVWSGASTVQVGGVVVAWAGRPFRRPERRLAQRFELAAGQCRGTFRKIPQLGHDHAGQCAFCQLRHLHLRLGILTVNSGYSSAANALLSCGLGGTAAGTIYGQLQSPGTVSLNGGLSVNLLPGIIPRPTTPTQSSPPGRRSGSFTTFAYPSNQVIMRSRATPRLQRIVRVTGNSRRRWC